MALQLAMAALQQVALSRQVNLSVGFPAFALTIWMG